MKKPSVLIALAMFASAVVAQSGGIWEIEKARTNAAAGDATGGAWQLNGLAGQPEAARLTGGGYELHGGFHAPSGSDLLFADSFE